MQFRLWVSPYVINPKNLVSTDNPRVLNPNAVGGCVFFSSAGLLVLRRVVCVCVCFTSFLGDHTCSLSVLQLLGACLCRQIGVQLQVYLEACRPNATTKC